MAHGSADPLSTGLLQPNIGNMDLKCFKSHSVCHIRSPSMVQSPFFDDKFAQRNLFSSRSPWHKQQPFGGCLYYPWQWWWLGDRLAQTSDNDKTADVNLGYCQVMPQLLTWLARGTSKKGQKRWTQDELWILTWKIAISSWHLKRHLDACQ